MTKKEVQFVIRHSSFVILFFSAMNPDKLFDYLDGKLSPADREELEDQLMSDAQLRRQFNVAREIHRSGRDAREVIVPDEDPAVAQKGAKLARRIAIAAIFLVFLNVFGGLAVITFRNKKPNALPARSTQIEKQVTESVTAAAQNAMPAPSISDGEISLTATKAEWENLANSVIQAAEKCGGSAIKDASEANILVIASIPKERVAEFRRTVLGPNAALDKTAPLTGEIATIQVRITAPTR